MLPALLPFLLLVTATPRPTLPPAFRAPPILMYHRVDPEWPPDAVGRQLTVTPERFREQLQYLKSQGMAAISMAQLERRLELGERIDRTVVLTFDDGYADQYTYALPLLENAGDFATFYIVTAEVGRREHMSWEQIRTVAEHHMDVAAHGVQHDDLSLMSREQQTYQIDTSVITLQHELHEAVDSYAYPSGRFNRTTLQVVRAAGVGLAVTTDPVYVLPPENRFEISRLRVRGDWSIADFAAALRAAEGRRHVVVR